MPDGFAALAEALAGEPDAVAARCALVGGMLADRGVALGEVLEELRRTTMLMCGRDPTYEETRAVATAWSEATLGYLNGLSCSDPLTGLSTQAHLRERLAELYRGAVAPRAHALVVAEARLAEPDQWHRARQLALLGEHARTVFGGRETVGLVGRARLVVLTSRDDRIANRVSLLRRMVEQLADRVWIEGLPATDRSAGLLLDELARA